MCSISGSFNSNKLKELVILNAYRGQHSHTFSYYNTKEHTLTITRGLGEIDLDIINIPEDCFGICHTQAPTTDVRDEQAIHPATFFANDLIHALWHNGIIKDVSVKELQITLNADDKWDTALLLKKLVATKTPADVDGTFSCLWFRPYEYGHGEMLLFRNEISPMFVDTELNISSTGFDGSNPTPPNTILRMNFERRILIPESTFETVECPYYFGE